MKTATGDERRKMIKYDQEREKKKENNRRLSYLPRVHDAAVGLAVPIQLRNDLREKETRGKRKTKKGEKREIEREK